MEFPQTSTNKTESQRAFDPAASVVNDNGAPDSLSNVWFQKAETYLKSGEFPSTSPSSDTRSPKDRARDFGLNNFRSLDWDGNGKFGVSNIRSVDNDSKYDPVGAAVMLQNFTVIDKTGDGMIDRDELVATSSERVTFPNLPTLVNRDMSQPDLVAQKKTAETIAEQLKTHPTTSENNYLDTTVKAMSTAIVNGDLKAVDAMVKTFANDPNAMEKITEGVEIALRGSGTRIRLNGKYMTVSSSKSNSDVTFSKTDAPVSLNFNVSAQDSMKAIGRATTDGNKEMIELHKREDKETIMKNDDSRLLDQLSKRLRGPLNDKDKEVAMRLLDRVRHGEPEFVQQILTKQLKTDPQSAYRIGKALNEITKGEDIDFNVISVRGETLMQIRNSKGDKALTLSPNRLNSYPNGIVGAERVKPFSESPKRLMNWVTDSIKHGRGRSLEKGE